jgi:hypothetical protein
MKQMSIDEFRDLGLLQEINRKFLHPLGLAMFVAIGAGAETTIGGIFDGRDDPEGFCFGGVDAGKARRVDQLFTERSHARLAELGYVIQPVDEDPPADGKQTKILRGQIGQ